MHVCIKVLKYEAYIIFLSSGENVLKDLFSYYKHTEFGNMLIFFFFLCLDVHPGKGLLSAAFSVCLFLASRAIPNTPDQQPGDPGLARQLPLRKVISASRMGLLLQFSTQVLKVVVKIK